MTKNNIALASLAMDLKRVALGFHLGSTKTALRFSQEAIKRKEEIDQSKLKLYIKKYLNKLPQVLKNHDKQKVAEDSLMYSTLFQNYVNAQN